MRPVEKCPTCNDPVIREELPDGSSFPFCGGCGWGADRLEAARAGELETETEGGPPSVAFVVAMWVVTLLVVVAPLVALLVASGTKLLLHYSVAMFCYLVLANTVSPAWDDTNMGLWGTRINNPFSLEDDRNRALANLALFLLPGKAVGEAVTGTYRLIRGS